MKLLVQGNNITVTEAIHLYVQEKLENAVRHFLNITTKVDVHLSVAKNPRINKSHKAEVTVHANGTVIRAQESSEDLYASIDMVADKITRQLRKYKEKHFLKNHKTSKAEELATKPPIASDIKDLIGDRKPELPPEVVRMKYFAMPPMKIDEALIQLQLVDHDFYVFRNSESNEINVIYIRNHGGYGVILPRESNGNGHHENNGKVSHPTSEVESTSDIPPAQV